MIWRGCLPWNLVVFSAIAPTDASNNSILYIRCPNLKIKKSFNYGSTQKRSNWRDWNRKKLYVNDEMNSFIKKLLLVYDMLRVSKYILIPTVYISGLFLSSSFSWLWLESWKSLKVSKTFITEQVEGLSEQPTASLQKM